ncbi:MAG: hypothetical protein JO210_04720 [Acidobacteriaceae bacterium]|nr:hypothetical protein [Acidobacteriaceae bacterium]
MMHGDAPWVNPGRQYAFGSNLADAVAGTRVVTLLKPGSAHPYEARSGGDRAIAFGDSCASSVVDNIAGAIESIKSHWEAPSVVLVGDSGAAAVAAYVAALHPGLVQHVVLIGCPCDVPALRSHVWRSQRNLLWLPAVHNLSPLQSLDYMGKAIKVTAISGMNDSITPPQYARSYVAKATTLGISASMIIIPSRGHEIMNDPVVIEDIADAVRDN